MNYLMKSLIIGAGNLQLIPQSIDYQKEIDTTLTIVKNRANKEGITEVDALKKLVYQKSIGLSLIFIYSMLCLVGTLMMGLVNYQWWVASIPIFSLWIIYPSLVYLKNKIIKNELIV